LFEFTEAEQQKLSQQHQQQQQNEQQNQTLVNSSNIASVTANNTNILEQTTIKPATAPPKPLNQQQHPPVTKNVNKLSNATDVYSTATESQSSDFDSTSNIINNSSTKHNSNIPSTITANVTATTAALTRQDKNDNLLNELKLTKEENDTLKKEIARLKVFIKI